MLVHHLTLFLLIAVLTSKSSRLVDVPSTTVGLDEIISLEETADLPTHDDIASLISRRRSESAERYFNWIRETQRK